MDLIQKLSEGEVLCAEGYVFELERRGYIQAPEFIPQVVLDHPEVVRQLHRDFAAAGSDVMVALTYYADRENMKHVNRESNLVRHNREALKIAKSVADEYGLLMAGDICDTHCYDPKRPEESREKVRAIYIEQVAWAKDEGANFIIAETLDHVAEALVALEVIKSFDLPAVITFGPAAAENTDDKYSLVDACALLAEKGADVVGLNCVMGPQTMLARMEELRAAVKGHLAALPVPYRTTEQCKSFMQLKRRDGSAAFPVFLESHLLDRKELANFALNAKSIGVNYLGICCGAGPHHVRAMAEALGRRVPASKYSPLPAAGAA